MLTAEITNTVYQNFLTLNQGFSLANNGAWLLLLNKVMGMVAEFKSSSLTKDDRIDLVVAVVIRYLDEKTDLADDQLRHITTSVRAMCIAMLGYGGELAGKQPVVRVPADPELVNTPLRITQLLMDKMRELIRRDPSATENLGSFLPQVVMLCITTVNKFRNLTNLEKRNLVVDVIISFIDEYLAPRLTTPAQQMSLGLFKADLGNMVDLFVGIAKGKAEYNFNYRDPVGRRNLFACLGTGFVRAVAVLGLCFSHRASANTTHTEPSTPTNPSITINPITSAELPSIPEETTTDISNELPNALPNELPNELQNEQKEEVYDEELSSSHSINDMDLPLPLTPPSEIEPAADMDSAVPDITLDTNPVELVQVIIDTVATKDGLDASTDV
jgi:hypothetical protein